jgi:hypothetical protein
MRRFVTLAVLLLFSIPFGVSISGCSKMPRLSSAMAATPAHHRPGHHHHPDTHRLWNLAELRGDRTGQHTLGTDCKGSSASVGSYTYGTTDMTIADVQPNTGRLCGGTWNRNSGGGIPDYTYCIPTNKSGSRLYLRQRRRRHQQSAADLHPSGGDQHRAGRSIVQLHDRSDHSLLPAGDRWARSRRRRIWQTPASRRDHRPAGRAGLRRHRRQPDQHQLPGGASASTRVQGASLPRRPSRRWSASTRTAWPPPTSRDRC